jgi:benzodiazapine receptor
MLLEGSRSWENTFIEPSLPKLLTPAPITFAIWGPIFILMAAFYVYQARDLLPGRDNIEMPYVTQVSVFFFLSSVLTSLWYVAWARRMILVSIVMMILYLATLLAAYFRLGINMFPRSRRERLIVTAGWSMYTGWVTVAALVNITTGLVYFGFDNLPLSEIQWTLGASMVAVIVYLMFLFKREDYVFAGVGAWAFIGLCITHLDPSPPSNQAVLITSLVGTAIIMASMVFKYLRA